MSTTDLADPRRRAFVTPEGIDLGLRVGSGGRRAGAFLIDAAIQVALLAALTAIALTAAVGTKGGGAMAAFAIWTLGFFALRNGYFLLFELGPRAATPGKRLMRLRVASRDGARLTAEAVFARNVFREAELFLPLTFLATSAGQEGWAIGLAGLAWSVGFGCLPLFNRDRLRAGDLVAGTWVVQAPRPVLLRDLAASGERLADRITFSPQELSLYGESELEVLDGVIRRHDRKEAREVATRIRSRLNRTAIPEERDLDFLEAFYAAQRLQLETGLLLGRRRLSRLDPSDAVTKS